MSRVVILTQEQLAEFAEDVAAKVPFMVIGNQIRYEWFEVLNKLKK